MKFYLGIDPGQSGGWAIITDEGRCVTCDLWKPGGIQRFEVALDEYEPPLSVHSITFACIEQVTSHRPYSGKLMKNAGFWLGYLYRADIATEEVAMGRWMKQIKTGKCPQDLRFEKARARWPEAPLSRAKDKDIGDALWIAEYARRTYIGVM